MTIWSAPAAAPRDFDIVSASLGPYRLKTTCAGSCCALSVHFAPQLDGLSPLAACQSRLRVVWPSVDRTYPECTMNQRSQRKFLAGPRLWKFRRDRSATDLSRAVRSTGRICMYSVLRTCSVHTVCTVIRSTERCNKQIQGKFLLVHACMHVLHCTVIHTYSTCAHRYSTLRYH